MMGVTHTSVHRTPLTPPPPCDPGVTLLIVTPAGGVESECRVRQAGRGGRPRGRTGAKETEESGGGERRRRAEAGLREQRRMGPESQWDCYKDGQLALFVLLLFFCPALTLEAK